jgi:hypothetical protein
MSVLQLRKELHKYLDEIKDESFLEAVYSIVAAFRKKEKTGIQRTLSPMTLEEYDAMIDKAEANIKSGAVFTEEQVREHLRRKHAI